MTTREEIETLLECDQDNGRPVISWGKLQWLCRLALAQLDALDEYASEDHVTDKTWTTFVSVASEP